MMYTFISFGFLVNGMNACCNVPEIAILKFITLPHVNDKGNTTFTLESCYCLSAIKAFKLID